MTPRKTRANPLIRERVAPSPSVEVHAASGGLQLAQDNESHGRFATRACAKPRADLSEPEGRWRREQVLRVLAEILRNPDDTGGR
jgi:hypothetical protein